MYEVLVKRLRELQPESFTFEIMNAMHEAADAIEKLQKDLERSKDFESFWQYEAGEALRKFQVAIANKPQWIPVTERLPEYAGVYLCRIKSFNGDFRYTDTMKYVDGFFYERGVATDRITHWMPLPEPPTQKEET